VSVDVAVPTVDGQGLPTYSAPLNLGEFGFDPRSAGGGVTAALTAAPADRQQALTVPLSVDGAAAPTNNSATQIARALFGDTILATATTGATTGNQVVVVLGGGSDGKVPTMPAYQGTELPERGIDGLKTLEDVSIVAAPGASSGWVPGGDDALAQAVAGAVATHCELMVYRVAALDTPRRKTTGQALDFRNLRSSTHAALYYPWLVTSHPVDGSRVTVPPAAYLAGIWARTDASRGVIKSPANEVVRSALDLEIRLNKAQQGLLNPEGVDCLRYFPGAGFLVWGARTISDDPAWKYLSIRRYFNYVEKSIDQGTQWCVFEINGPELWQAVTTTIEGFLLNEWKSGALLGSKPEEGYFVRCDASTMTQNDLDNGRLVCQIGIAAAKPAEFVIFRVSQWTASATS
jgi:phage tail sheath protein FI